MKNPCSTGSPASIINPDFFRWKILISFIMFDSGACSFEVHRRGFLTNGCCLFLFVLHQQLEALQDPRDIHIYMLLFDIHILEARESVIICVVEI
jgi:hypothetical protein